MENSIDNNAAPVEERAIAKEFKKEHRHSPLFVVLTIVFGLGLAALAVVNVLILTNEPGNCKVSSSANKNTGDDEKGQDDNGSEGPNNIAEPTDKEEFGPLTITISANTKSVTIEEECSSDSTSDCETGYSEFIAYDYTAAVATPDSKNINYSDIRREGDKIVVERINGDFDGRTFKGATKKTAKISGTIKQLVMIPFGVGGNEAILMLKDNGTVAAIRLDDEGEDLYVIDEIKGLSNIVGIYFGAEEGSNSGFAVDASGKAYGLYRYIWPNR